MTVTEKFRSSIGLPRYLPNRQSEFPSHSHESRTRKSQCKRTSRWRHLWYRCGGMTPPVRPLKSFIPLLVPRSFRGFWQGLLLGSTWCRELLASPCTQRNLCVRRISVYRFVCVKITDYAIPGKADDTIHSNHYIQNSKNLLSETGIRGIMGVQLRPPLSIGWCCDVREVITFPKFGPPRR